MKNLYVNFSAILLINLFIPVSLYSQALNYQVDSTGGIDFISWDGGSTEIEFTDINNDGYMDFISIGDHGNPAVNTNQHGIMVWFGNGTGTNWTVAQGGSFGYGGIAVGDVNNDGYKDVGYGMHHNYSGVDLGDQLMEVSLGDGTGINWTPWDDSLGLNGQSWGMSGTDFGDIDNDGLLDIGSNSFGCCDGVHIHRNTGTGVWQHVFGFLLGNSNMKFRFGDIDNDGNLDFVVGQEHGTCYFGDGTGNFTLNDSGLVDPGPVGFLDLSLADVDNDGTLELGCLVGGVGRIYKFSSVSQTWQLMSAALPAFTQYSFTLKDMDIDGFVDLVSFQSDKMVVYRGDGGNSWIQATLDTVSELERVWETAVADVDHSGTPDVIMLGRYPTGIVTDVVKMKMFRETRTVTSLNIAAIYPKGHECFPHNSIRFVEWISSVPQGTKSKVTLEYSSTGISGPWTLIDSGLPDNGKFQWTVPSNVSSANCYIRYTISDSLNTVTSVSISPQSFNIGCVSTTGVKPIRNTNNQLVIYPNPLHGESEIFVRGIEDKVKLAGLYNIEGKLLFSETPENDLTVVIQTGSLVPGIYILKIRFENETEVNRKIVVH